MEIGRYIVLSTAHVRVETARLLEEWAKLPAADQPLAIASTQYGWFVSTHDASNKSQGLPPEIAGIVAYGRVHECTYVLLDCDGPVQAPLPIYPW